MRDVTIPFDPQWYIPKEEMLTDFELKGSVPPSVIQTYVCGKMNWRQFVSFLHQTSSAIERSLRGTDLEGKIAPYTGSLPHTEETPEVYFYRTSRKLKASPEYAAGHSQIFEEISTGKRFEDTVNSISMAIPAGEKILATDVKILKTEKDKIKRTQIREVSRLTKYDIGFSTGLSINSDWFYAFSLEDEEHLDIYERLQRNIRGIDVLNMLTPKDDTWKQFGTKIRVYGYRN